MPIGTLPGQVLASGVTSPTVEDVRICFGEIEAVPIFAGLSSFVALYQIVVTVPNVPPGDVLVLAKVAGLQSQDGISINVAAPYEDLKRDCCGLHGRRAGFSNWPDAGQLGPPHRLRFPSG